MGETRQNIDKLRTLLVNSVEKGKGFLKNLHPSEIALILEEVSPESRQRIIGLLTPELASEAISEMDEETNPWEIFSQLSPERSAQIIEELDPDDAADLLAQLPKTDLRKIFDRIPDEEEEVIEKLMTYDEDSAGGIMNPDVLKIPANFTKRQAVEEVIRISEEMENFYAIYVVDEFDHLIGVVPLKTLIISRSHEKIGDMIEDKLIKVLVDADQEEAARLMQQYNLPALPVVDERGHLLGRITFDDVMDVLEEESTEDVLKLAGVSEDESLRGGWLAAVKSRIPWLLINLLTASTAGFVISVFSETISQMVIITAYMPVIAGVAGNGATQTLAVTIRRIATDGIPPRAYLGVIWKEVSVGITNGLLLGAVVGTVAWLLNDTPMLGLVVFLALVGNLFIAGFAGSAVPLLLQRAGVDPAVASSILITAFTDILGYLLLFSIGTMLLL